MIIPHNGPQFRFQEYETFAKAWDFTHLTSSPYHSRSNGKAEVAVKIVKSLLRKDDGDPFLAMLNWQNTPTESSYSRISVIRTPMYFFILKSVQITDYI